MYLFLSLAIVYSLPLYGNFSQYYYYTEIEFKDVKQPWIIDSSFDGAIYGEVDPNKKYTNVQQQIIQGFITAVSGEDGIETIDVENNTIQVRRGVYQPYQEINNYLGLMKYIIPEKEEGNSSIFKKNEKKLKSLRLCLSNNGGYFSLNDTEETSNKINLLYSNQLLITNILADGERQPIQAFKATVDFNYPYLELPLAIKKTLTNAIICADLFCPKRKDQNEMICYEREGMELNTFYQHFKDIEFQISYQSVIWYPQDYFVTTDDNIYCFPVKTSIARNVLGQPFLKNKEVIFAGDQITMYYNNCKNETEELKLQRKRIPENKRTQGYSRVQIEYFLMIITCLIGYAIIRIKKELPQSPINPYTDYQ